jgi:hypothetical protein
MAQGGGVQQAVQQTAAENKRKLLPYQWTETTLIKLNGLADSQRFLHQTNATGTGLIQMFPNIASPAVSLPLEESGQLDNILIFYCSDNARPAKAVRTDRKMKAGFSYFGCRATGSSAGLSHTHPGNNA